MRALFTFWLSHRAELANLFGQHVLLVAGSTFIAVALGVPLGLFSAKRPRLASPLMAIASIVQTVPSLAMFGFLLPVPIIGGVGARAALVVLILYVRVCPSSAKSGCARRVTCLLPVRIKALVAATVRLNHPRYRGLDALSLVHELAMGAASTFGGVTRQYCPVNLEHLPADQPLPVADEQHLCEDRQDRAARPTSS